MKRPPRKYISVSSIFYDDEIEYYNKTSWGRKYLENRRAAVERRENEEYRNFADKFLVDLSFDDQPEGRLFFFAICFIFFLFFLSCSSPNGLEDLTLKALALFMVGYLIIRTIIRPDDTKAVFFRLFHWWRLKEQKYRIR